MTYYNPICPKCYKPMVCTKEDLNETTSHIKEYKVRVRREEFYCPKCDVVKKFTDKTEIIYD